MQCGSAHATQLTRYAVRAGGAGRIDGHDEDDRDEGEEDAVDVYFWELGRRLIMLWSFSFVTSIATPCFSPQG